MRVSVAIAIMIFTISELGAPACASDRIPVPGWRYPIETDISGDWAEYREQLPSPFHASADFNGDGEKDHAWILFSERNRDAWGLFVILGAASGKHKIIELLRDTGNSSAQNHGISIEEPGSYKTWCGKRRKCKFGEPEKFELAMPGLGFFKYESAASTFFWDNGSGSFRQLWTSD